MNEHTDLSHLKLGTGDMIGIFAIAAVMALALRLLVDAIVDHEQRIGDLAQRLHAVEWPASSDGIPWGSPPAREERPQ